MELVVFIVVVVLGSLASAQDNQTTLDGLFLSEYQQHLRKILISQLKPDSEVQNDSFLQLTLSMELLHYTKAYVTAIASEFSWDLGNVSVQTVYEAINGNCSMEIKDLTVYVENMTCVEPLMRRMATTKMKHAIDSVLQRSSPHCDQTFSSLCSAERRNCTTVYEQRVRILMTRYVQDVIAVNPVLLTKPLRITAEIVYSIANMLNANFWGPNFGFLVQEAYNISNQSIDPFGLNNILRPWNKKILVNDLSYMFYDELSWGIIKSNVGGVSYVCCDCPDTKYTPIWFDSSELESTCYIVNMFHSFMDLISCTSNYPTERPLTWRSDPNIYFNSPCLCVVFKGVNCGVNPPPGVHPRNYCLFVLLRDFQRRITYRPAVTYLDYAFQTPISLCNFTKLIFSTLATWYEDSKTIPPFHEIISMQCYFKGLVNKDLNCSERLPLNTFNESVLCGFGYFMNFVLCDDESNSFNVYYYRAGDSTLVQLLTYADVISRVLTLLSYVACPPLRNIPGKLMVCYLLTTLVRVLVVRLTLQDLQWAVRLDVTMDLASTLWLTAYLHFLTTSIKTLRLPNSLTSSETRQVFLRYSLFGWVLPAALSAIFFWMNEVIDSFAQFGQVLFMLCTYAALFTNLYMFFFNCSFYYDVISSASDLGPGVKPRKVFADIFNFALKTSVLSGAGIIFRLILTQIPGLEHFLGYYHVVGTLQGFLLFLLYGCCREARDYWLNVFSRVIGRCNCHQNTSPRDNFLQLVEIPVAESPQNCSSS